MGSWVEEGPLCSRAAPGSCCPALPPAWHEWVAPAHSLGQQQLCILIPLNHYSDLSYYSFVFLKGQCPGTFLLFALYFACKSLLESWMGCLPLLRVLSCLAESFLPTSSDEGGSVCVGGWGWGCRLSSHLQGMWHQFLFIQCHWLISVWCQNYNLSLTWEIIP